MCRYLQSTTMLNWERAWNNSNKVKHKQFCVTQLDIQFSKQLSSLLCASNLALGNETSVIFIGELIDCLQKIFFFQVTFHPNHGKLNTKVFIQKYLHCSLSGLLLIIYLVRSVIKVKMSTIQRQKNRTESDSERVYKQSMGKLTLTPKC